jgi:uncharacterized glyoxalase superfamily protein PhnB
MQNKSVKPIPEGYHTLTPFIIADGAKSVIEFLKKAFDAKVHDVHEQPDGKIMHAALQIGDSMLMMSDASERFPSSKIMINMYVEDVDATYKKAVAAGGTSLREPTNEFYGDRSCGVMDAAGNQWWIATHVEDVSPEEMEKRMQEFLKQHQSA